MPKQIVGNVHWIENGKQTSRLVDVGVAFSDPDQAAAQVLFVEASGDREQIRLVRLAYRQYQGQRYRKQETTPRKAKPNVSKPNKSPTEKSGRKPSIEHRRIT